MPSATRKSKASPTSKTPRPPRPEEAMELASLHQGCLHLEYHAMRIYANAPEKHAEISNILREALAKLRATPFEHRFSCGSGYIDCNGECIPKSEGCQPGPSDPKVKAKK